MLHSPSGVESSTLDFVWYIHFSLGVDPSNPPTASLIGNCNHYSWTLKRDNYLCASSVSFALEKVSDPALEVALNPGLSPQAKTLLYDPYGAIYKLHVLTIDGPGAINPGMNSVNLPDASLKEYGFIPDFSVQIYRGGAVDQGDSKMGSGSSKGGGGKGGGLPEIPVQVQDEPVLAPVSDPFL